MTTNHNPLDNIMDVHEASALWGTTSHYVKKLCALGKIECKKIGKTWVVRRDQPNPMKKSAE